jgi:hypothetical protein
MVSASLVTQGTLFAHLSPFEQLFGLQCSYPIKIASFGALLMLIATLVSDKIAKLAYFHA